MRRRKAPDKTEVLKRVPLFGGLSKRALTEVAKILPANSSSNSAGGESPPSRIAWIVE